VAELVPILGALVAGVVIGLRFEARRARLVLIGAASIVIGVFAGLVSGELAESPAFLAIDMPGALLAQAVAVFSVDRLERRAAGERSRP
jgi:hypothetical protein